MGTHAYAFNRDAKYPVGSGFPKHLTSRDLQELHIQVVVPEKVDGRGDFTASLQDLLSKYKLPHVGADRIVDRWQQAPMSFYQNQVNFAVWCATTGCGISWRDHLDIDRPLTRAVFRFHVYYQVRRILSELQAPLPQDPSWDPLHNTFDQRAYERICREFDLDPAGTANWRQTESDSGGLGTVYQYNHGYQPRGSFNKNRQRFQPDGATDQWGKEHIDYIAQGHEADNAWSAFILDNSQGFTAPGSERLNDSIRTYVWAVLGAQAQTRTTILGSGTAFDAQKQFQANLEDAIHSPVDIPSAIQRYQSVLQNASSEVNYIFGAGLYMAPSDMRLHIGTIVGYNNEIVIAPIGQPLGEVTDINRSLPPPDKANDTGEKGLVVPQPSASAAPPSVAQLPKIPYRAAGTPAIKSTDTQSHDNEKTALVVGCVAIGLTALWLARRY